MLATTIQQSKHLLELGLDPKTADMCLCKTAHDTWFSCAYTPSKYDAHTVPAWSLSALLEVMPNNDYWEICLWQYKDQRWQCVFDDVEFSNGETKAFVADTPIDAAYEMVCWLLENNLIKKGGQDGK